MEGSEAMWLTDCNGREVSAATKELQVVEHEYLSNRRYSGTKVGRSTARASRRSSTSLGAEIGKVVLKELKGTTGRRIVRGILGGLIRGR